MPKNTDRDDRLAEVWGQTLAGEGVKLTAPGLTAALDSRKLHVRTGAVILLGRRGEKSAIPLLKPLLEDRIAIVRVEAAMSLCLLGDLSGMPVLTAALDEDLLTGAPTTAAGYLAARGDPAGWKIILKAFGSPLAGIRLNAAVALKSFLPYHAQIINGEKIDIAGLVDRTMVDSDALVRREIIYKLAGLEDERSVPILKRVAKTDGDESIRAAAQQLLAGRPRYG
jgi:HEAT repeat protein